MGVDFLYLVVLLNVALTIKLVRQARIYQTIQDNIRVDEPAELPVESEAPGYHALTLNEKTIDGSRFEDARVLFVFVSPNCASCQRMLAVAAAIGPVAESASGVQVVLVTDAGAARTRDWIEQAAYETGTKFTGPVLIAPASQTSMIRDFNPRGLLPYFCLLDRNSVVARGAVDGTEWNEVVSRWEPVREGR